MHSEKPLLCPGGVDRVHGYPAGYFGNSEPAMSESAPAETAGMKWTHLYVDFQSLRCEDCYDLFVYLHSLITGVWMIADNSSLRWESIGVGVYVRLPGGFSIDDLSIDVMGIR